MDPFAYAPTAATAPEPPDAGPLPAGYAYSHPEAFAAPVRTDQRAAPAPMTARPAPIAFVGWSAVTLLVVQAALSLALTGLSAWSSVSFAALRPGEVAAQPLPALLQSVGGPVLYLTMPLCGLAFCGWLLVALRNVRAWGHQLRRGTGWSFGAWFVPVVQLWWPKQLVDDAWRGSRPDVPDGLPLQAVPKPGATAAWWLLWLAAPAVLQVGVLNAVRPVLTDVMAAARLGVDPMTAVDVVGVQETVALWSMWAYALWTLCALLAAYVVGQVTAWQTARLREAGA